MLISDTCNKPSNTQLYVYNWYADAIESDKGMYVCTYTYISNKRGYVGGGAAEEAVTLAAFYLNY